MSARKFRFVSPGIFINEIDQSQIPADSELVGPVIIGRAEKGPGMIPVRINSFSDFVETFGNPIDGTGGEQDTWRGGNRNSPTYGAYAAQAYLKAGVGPVNFVRLMGVQHDEADSDGQAGWKTAASHNVAIGSTGGSYGLFIFSSGSLIGAAANGVANTGDSIVNHSGTLAATFYMDSGIPVLSGNVPSSSLGPLSPHEGTCTVVASDSNGNFKLRVLSSAGAEVKSATCNMAESSANWIRNQFNTNPQLLNSTIESSNNATSYFLGETYERAIDDLGLTAPYHGIILGIGSGTTGVGPWDREQPYRDSHSGWFFAQSFLASPTTSSYRYDDMQKLFKFVGINGHGEWLQDNIKISIDNIKAAENDNYQYGTFDVVLRKASDSDAQPSIIERYSACSLDPTSPDYVAIKIGDTYQNWDSTENRYREYGDYPNRSRYIRVVLNDSVKNGATPSACLPFGVYGPPRFRHFEFHSGSSKASVEDNGGLGGIFAKGSGSNMSRNAAGSTDDAGKLDNATIGWVYSGQNPITATNLSEGSAFGTASIVFPACGIRSTATQDGATLNSAYFGLHTGKTSTSTTHDTGYPDYLRSHGSDVVSSDVWGDTFGEAGYPAPNFTEQWVFSLDEMVLGTGSNFDGSKPTTGLTEATWTSGSLATGDSWTGSGSTDGNLGECRYQNILDSKINRFTSPMFGAYDGLDITERDPFRNTVIGSSETGDYVYHTIRRAINTVADPEMLSCNLITIPGLTNEALTKYLIDVCDSRADALAVIDVKGGFQPRHESNSAITSRRGNLDSVLSNIKARNLNSSYGCAYYPWVTIRDDIAGTYVKVPPSVVAMGVMANTEKKADVWFAPAGFNRGGLSQGASGLTVTGVETKLTSRNRDDLYDVNINPIASFPSEGIVVFGQKTLQATRSALDRINVRRLLIYMKKGISQIAATTLFQPNVRDTWNGFKSRAENFLSDVKVRFGIDDFKIILDESTTTPDLVDRNIMYAKIFIKPTRAIEFIAIDFVITRSGASFED